MSQTVTPARIALLHGAASMFGGRLPSTGQTSPREGLNEYNGIARLLLDSGFTHDSVFLPDTTYSILPLLQAADHANHSCHILATG